MSRRPRWFRPGCALSVLALTLLVSASASPQAPPTEPPPAPGSPAPDAPAQASPSPGAPAGQSSFPTAVELVTVDVAVVDKKGQPVAGLTKDDFAVKDDGVPQNLSSFEAVVVPAPSRASVPSPPPPREPISTNAVPVSRRGRTFLVVFDDIHLSPLQAQRARGAVAAFLQSGVSPGDRVTLVATGGGAWWNETMPGGRDALIAILKRLDGRYVPDPSPDRITEFEAMRIEEYQDEAMAWQVKRRFDAYGAVGQEKDPRGVRPPDAVSSAPGMIPEVVRMRAREVHDLARSRDKIACDVMARVIQSVSDVKGRKAMILVSQGFVYDIQLRAMKDVVMASRRANVPIYFIDTRGLQGLPDAFTAAFGRPIEAQDTVAVLADLSREAEGSESLALDTGGFVVKNSNDLAGGISRVSAESRVYYLLGYTPPDLKRDGRFRKIEVKLTDRSRKGLSVRARRGYYAPLEGAPAGKPGEHTDPLIAKALDSPFEEEGVPLRVSSFVFDETLLNQMSVTIATEIDIRKLGFKEEESRANDALAFIIEAQHRESGEYYRYDQKIEMSLLEATRRRLERTWYTVAREFTLPAGGYQAKVVVKDLNSGKVGSVIHEFEVPSGGRLRVSTPVLSDRLEPGEGGTQRPVLQVRRSFARGSVLYCQYSVFGAAREEKGSLMPDVTAGYEIRRADGKVFKRGAPTRINPTSLGALMRLSGISLQGAGPGGYELILTVRDELAGKSVKVREPFEIGAS
jgi:VWFA-related protein